MGIVSGAPQGTTVDLSGAKVETTTTNSIGFYQFTGLSNGSYTVTPSMPGYTLSPASYPVTISSAHATNRNFAVVFGIAGSVKTGTGTGVAGATITLVNSSGTATTRTTDANGDYSALGLTAGAYTLSASAGGYAISPVNQKATVTCDVRTGVDFTATAGITYSILGTAWSDTSHTFPQSNVLMVLSGDNSGMVYTSASGTYAFTGLLSGGSYTLRPSRFTIQEQSYTPPVVLSSDIIWDFVGNKMATIMPQIPVSCMDLTGAIAGPGGNGATVDILYRSYSVSTTTAADSSGNYLKSVPSGSFVITPSKVGYTFLPPRICGGDDTCNITTTVTITGNFTSQ